MNSWETQERYCHIVKKNVFVELERAEGGERVTSCLHAHECDRTRGSCSNCFYGPYSEEQR